MHKTNHSFSRAQLAGGADNLLSSRVLVEGLHKFGAPTTSSNSNSDDQKVLPPPPAVLPLFSRFRLSFLHRTEKRKRPASFGSSKRRTSSVSTTIPVFRVPVDVRTVRDNTQSTSATVDKELDTLRPIPGVHEQFPEERQVDQLQDHDARDELMLMRINERREPIGRLGFDLDPSVVNVERHLEENDEAPHASITHEPRWASKLQFFGDVTFLTSQKGVQGTASSRWPPPNLIPAFWRIFIFQVYVFIILSAYPEFKTLQSIHRYSSLNMYIDNYRCS